MPAKKRVLGSDLKKSDRHVVQPHEYDEIPELTEAWFTSADHRRAGKLVADGKLAEKRLQRFRCRPRTRRTTRRTSPRPEWRRIIAAWISHTTGSFGRSGISTSPIARRPRQIGLIMG
jgi:hypothetical protein